MRIHGLLFAKALKPGTHKDYLFVMYCHIIDYLKTQRLNTINIYHVTQIL